MSDEDRRRHERAASAGDEAARVRVLRERLRDGTLLPSRLELAAYCGDAAAFEALEPERRATLRVHEWSTFDRPGGDETSELWAHFERAGPDAERRAASAAVAHAFERFAATPALAPARKALAACFDKAEPPDAAGVRAALDAVRRSIASATVLPSLLEALMAAEQLEQALRAERAFANAFHAASRAIGVRACFHAASEKMRRWADDHAPELAAVLGSPHARRVRRPELDRARWLDGVTRWGTVPARLAAEGTSAVLAFALAPTAPLFSLMNLDVIEEVVDEDGGLTFRAREPSSGEPREIVALGPQLSNSGLRGVLEPLRVLDHPNLARLIALSLTPPRECVRTSLAVYARREGRPLGAWALALATEEKLAILEQAARGLEHAHAKGIFHAGLRPESIRVDGEVARVVDFGALGLRMLAFEEDPEREPEPGAVHPFFAPEFLKHGPGAVTAATDVYGLAAVALWLFLGREPFAGPTEIDMLKNLISEPAPRSPVKPDVIARALEKEPEERFASLADFRRALLGE